MLQIRCPWCGVRDETEFQYRGDATIKRPPADASADMFYEYVYTRTNPKGWQQEYWHHLSGCRRMVKVVRHTLTHAIAATGWPSDALETPSA
ncbi:MAG: sarcosine oxidase subunit delta [Gammaproteobacteria bacterium]|nr:sarcosine oxidase subunit delta [Gammaproteobacteria bacterium]